MEQGLIYADSIITWIMLLVMDDRELSGWLLYPSVLDSDACQAVMDNGGGESVWFSMETTLHGNHSLHAPA